MMGLELLRPDRKDETYAGGNLGGVRQRIESVNQASPAVSPARVLETAKPTKCTRDPGSLA